VGAASVSVGGKPTASAPFQVVRMTAIGQHKEETVATSFPAPEVAAGQRVGSEVAGRAEGLSVLARAGRLLRRGYERACSAIFDSDGDCMRL
jgi:hypothetical protein